MEMGHEKVKSTLLLDMDDTTVDQSLVWVEKVYERTGILLEREKWTQWDLNTILPSEIVQMIFAEINQEPGFYRQLRAKPGAIQGIRTLHKIYDIVFVSASEHYGYADKYRWIEENLPFLEKNNLILTHRKDLVIGDILVDDGPHNILASPSQIKIVFDQPWNRQLTNYPRVSNWKQLTNLLMKYSKKLHCA
jgi:5'-nucleotidase